MAFGVWMFISSMAEAFGIEPRYSGIHGLEARVMVGIQAAALVTAIFGDQKRSGAKA